MRRSRISIKSIFLFIISFWSVVSVIYIMTQQYEQSGDANLASNVNRLKQQVHDQLESNLNMIKLLHNNVEVNGQGLPVSLKEIDSRNPHDVEKTSSYLSNEIDLKANEPIALLPNHVNITHADQLPVIVMACNRVTVSRTLDQVLKYRPSMTKFPLLVSQDCGDSMTASVIRGYGKQLEHLVHPDLSPITLPPKERRFEGYYKIARHYKWALDEVFLRLNYSWVIILEDDLDISPDFFEFFEALSRVMQRDTTIWCASAWNDNGLASLIDENAVSLLYRSDFFGGLGWMTRREVWLQIRANWPVTFWDEYMRKPYVRLERSCIRPEISRTWTFGEVGVSKGQYYDKHLQFIKLNEKLVPFTRIDLTYLDKVLYDRKFVREVYSAPTVNLSDLKNPKAAQSSSVVRVEYTSSAQFKDIAKVLGLMDDFKAGVPRTAYRGVVSLFQAEFRRRVYVAPPPLWTGYNASWI